MTNDIDPKALALAKAIRRTETGGHKDPYNARGASGEFGAFQFMPATYKILAQKHLGDANAAPTVENQNKIVYSEVKSLKDQGYNPAQIASIWNSGKPDKYKSGGIGVNKYGVNYNVPDYVKKVSQAYRDISGSVQAPVEQVAPVPTIEDEKTALQEQGQPISVGTKRAQPTVGGNILRGALKPFVSAATTVLPVARGIKDLVDGGGTKSTEEIYAPIKTKYLGDVYSPGAKGIIQSQNAENVGQVFKGATKAVADIAGKGAELGSYATGAGEIKAGLKTLPALKQAAISGAKIGALGGFGTGLQDAAEAPTFGKAVGEVAKQTAIGGVSGALLEGAGVGIGKGINKYATRNLPENISSNIDKDIANIFKGTTGDIEKIRTSAFKARKGIELLQKESPNIKIPDESAPLGSRVTKEFNPATAKPNELLSGVKELDNLIVDKMKKATEDARSRGFEVNTNDAKLIIQDAIDSGDVPEATAKRMLKQIDNIGNDPVKAHDWVQDVNMKYKKKYERGTIEDTAIGSLADDVAQTLRNNLDTIVDRKGYAEAYGNNQELKRMLVAVAKKANKQVNWGDITTDAGLDAAISILTGNPAYMARTVATSLFKNIWSKFRNSSGLRSFRNAVEGASKLPTETRLPYSVAKPQFKGNLALGEGKGFENKAGIQLPSPKKPTTFEPSVQKNVKQPAKTIQIPINTSEIVPPKKSPTIPSNIKTPKKSNVDISTQLPKAKTKSSDLSTEAKKYKSADELFNAIKEALKRNSYNQEELFPDRIGYKSTMNAEQMLKNSKDNLDRARNKTVREGGTGRPTREYEQSLKFWEKSVKEKQDILNKLEENNRIYESTKDKYTNSVALEKLKELKRISEDDYRLIKTFLDYQLENGAFTKMSQLEELLNKANKPKRIISEESYKKALKNLGDTSTLNSTPIHLSKDALIVAGYHIENGVRSAAELGIELAKKGYKFTKEQLDELWNKANKSPLPKSKVKSSDLSTGGKSSALFSLKKDAKNYNNIEDFINSLEYIKTLNKGKYGSSKLSPTEIGSWSVKNVMDKNMNNYSGDVGKKLFEKSKLKNLDSYTLQEFFDSNKILGGLEGDMKNGYKVYRVVPKNGNINTGDFVFTNKKSANEFLEKYGKDRNQVEIKSKIVKSDELILPVPEDVLLKQVQRLRPYNTHRVDEFIYAPKSIQGITKSQLEEIWKKANKSPLPKAKKVSNDVYKGEKDLTTKILKDLEGKTTVSKQYILDATNRPELKQVERDLTRQILDTMPGKDVNVKEFADKVKSELLPLTVRNQKVTVSQAKTQLKNMGYTIEKEMDGGASIIDRNGDFVEYDEMTPEAQRLVDRVFGTAETYDQIGGNKYENIALPDDIRGNVKNYKENIYESPIKTSAGSTHFSGQTDNYFGHTRIEDMADNNTRRVIEVQSDLYQKGNLEKENPTDLFDKKELKNPKDKEAIARMTKANDQIKTRQSEVAKLQQYTNPTAHFRMVREEIKKASQDGKTKLQFPTGETAMKIEGLGARTAFHETFMNGRRAVDPDTLKIGQEVFQAGQDDAWIITNVLGDGKFKAIQKDSLDDLMENAGIASDTIEPNDAIAYAERHISDFDRNMETFDISGKVDTNNPIYRFYEKDLQKYLQKFDGKRVKDSKGIEWIEVHIKKEYGKLPVEAFALAGLTALPAGMAMFPKKKE